MDEKRMKRILIGMLLAGGLCGGAARAAESPQALFEEAVLQETGERNLEKALALYKKILQQVPENDPVSIKARLQIGLCLEKMGTVNWEEAKTAFQIVIVLARDKAPEDAQIAETHLRRLEEKRQASLSQTPPLQPEPGKADWKFSLETALLKKTIRTNGQAPLFKRPPLWASLGRKISSSLHVGMETGHFTAEEKSVDASFYFFQSGGFQFDSYTLDYANTATYVGPFVEAKTKGRRISASFHAGAGTLFEKQKLTVSLKNGFVGPFHNTQRKSGVSPSISLAAAMSYRLSENISINVGVRDQISWLSGQDLNRDAYFESKFNRNGALKVNRIQKQGFGHILIPVAGLSARF